MARLGLSWAIWELSWDRFGPSRDHPGSSGRLLGGSRAALGRVLNLKITRDAILSTGMGPKYPCPILPVRGPHPDAHPDADPDAHPDAHCEDPHPDLVKPQVFLGFGLVLCPSLSCGEYTFNSFSFFTPLVYFLFWQHLGS